MGPAARLPTRSDRKPRRLGEDAQAAWLGAAPAGPAQGALSVLALGLDGAGALLGAGVEDGGEIEMMLARLLGHRALGQLPFLLGPASVEAADAHLFLPPGRRA